MRGTLYRKTKETDTKILVWYIGILVHMMGRVS